LEDLFVRVGKGYLDSLIDDWKDLAEDVESMSEPMPLLLPEERDSLMAFIERHGLSVDEESELLVLDLLPRDEESRPVMYFRIWEGGETKHSFDEDAFRSALGKLGYFFFEKVVNTFTRELLRAFIEGSREAEFRFEAYEEYLDPDVLSALEELAARSTEKELEENGYRAVVEPINGCLGVRAKLIG